MNDVITTIVIKTNIEYNIIIINIIIILSKFHYELSLQGWQAAADADRRGCPDATSSGTPG
jgi:hypothetical protein